MKKINNKKIGQLIKEEVERKGLSVKEFAEKFVIRELTYTKYTIKPISTQHFLDVYQKF